MVELLEEDLISLNLGSKDDDQRRLFRKKVRDKWNQLVFVPMSVLSMRDQTSGAKAGKRGLSRFQQTVLQTVWKVLSHSIWFELPYLLLFLLLSGHPSSRLPHQGQP